MIIGEIKRYNIEILYLDTLTKLNSQQYIELTSLPHHISIR